MSGETQPSAAAPGQAANYQEDAIYQDGKIVARVVDPEIHGNAREIHFGEIHNSDYLLLPEECEFQKYRVIIQRIEFASHLDRTAPEKGRVLRGVVAEILGYREQ